MSLWGANSAAAGDKPKYLATANAAETEGITVSEAQAASGGVLTNPGWVQIRRKPGPIKSVTVTAAGTAYANTDTVVFTANSSGGSGAAATLTTNANGAITAINITAGGSGYVDAPVVSITTSTGSGATLTPVLGGSAIYETLVAMKSLS